MKRGAYPADWAQVSARIRERDGNRCKFCGLPNGFLIHRDPKTGEPERHNDGSFRDFSEDAATVDSRSMEGERFVRVVLTVAHLGTAHADGRPGDPADKLDNRDENLAALCQRCHLRHDTDERRRSASSTRARRLAGGAASLFDLTPAEG